MHSCSTRTWNGKVEKPSRNLSYLIWRVHLLNSDHAVLIAGAGYLDSYLSTHTKGNPQSSKWTTSPASADPSAILPTEIMKAFLLTDFSFFVVFLLLLQEMRGKCCHGYCHHLSSLIPLIHTLHLHLPPRLEQTIAVISTHAVWQVGFFEMTQWAEVIVLMQCSRGAIRSLIHCAAPLCVCAASAAV